jgi:hypothetical protein
MDHETPFLVALGTLVIAAFVVAVAGWVLLVRERGIIRSGAGTAAHHREATEDR